MPNNKPSYSGDDEVIQRNMERSREVIEARKNRDGETALDELPTDDTFDTENEDRVPGQNDVPAGGQSNMNVNGGTANRKKRGG